MLCIYIIILYINASTCHQSLYQGWLHLVKFLKCSYSASDITRLSEAISILNEKSFPSDTTPPCMLILA